MPRQPSVTNFGTANLACRGAAANGRSGALAGGSLLRRSSVPRVRRWGVRSRGEPRAWWFTPADRRNRSEFRDLPIYRTLTPEKARLRWAGMVFRHRRCGTGIWPDRDIAAGWRAIETRGASLPTRSPSQPRTPARKAGVLDLRKWMRPRDRLSAGGRRIRTTGPSRRNESVFAAEREVPQRKQDAPNPPSS